MDSDYLLAGGRFVLPEAVLDGGALLVEKGRIARIYAAGEPLPTGPARIDAKGAWVTPGLMELHIHGAGGVGFEALGLGASKRAGAEADPDAMDRPGEPERPGDAQAAARDLEGVAAFLEARGVTAFLPTLVAEPRSAERLALALETAAFPAHRVPGIYIEGPFVNPARRGGIPQEFLREVGPKILDSYLQAARGRLKVMTYAPELPGADSLPGRLAEEGVLPALGHSDAVLGRFEPPEGPYSLTHHFNAMSPFSHKEPGLAMLPFLDPRPSVELVSDGVHVNDEALRICAAAFGSGRILLISDACAAAGLPDGEYEYFGRRIVSGERGVRYADSGVLMGSRRLGPELLRNWLRATGRPVHEAVLALTRNPRRLVGVLDRGSIEPGQAAELVVWEGEFEAPRLVLR